MKAYIGVDVDSALVHAMRAALGKAADVTEGNSVLRGRATDVFGPRATKIQDAREGVDASELLPGMWRRAQCEAKKDGPMGSKRKAPPIEKTQLCGNLSQDLFGRSLTD